MNRYEKIMQRCLHEESSCEIDPEFYSIKTEAIHPYDKSEEMEMRRRYDEPERLVKLREEELRILTPEEEEKQRIWIEDCIAKAKEAHKTFWKWHDASAK